MRAHDVDAQMRHDGLPGRSHAGGACEVNDRRRRGLSHTRCDCSAVLQINRPPLDALGFGRLRAARPAPGDDGPSAGRASEKMSADKPGRARHEDRVLIDH